MTLTERLNRLTEKKSLLDLRRPLTQSELRRLKDYFDVERSLDIYLAAHE